MTTKLLTHLLWATMASSVAIPASALDVPLVYESHYGPKDVDLAAGDHTLTIKWREDDTRLDRIIITSDPEFDPASGAAAPDAFHFSIEAEAGKLTAPMAICVKPERPAAAPTVLGRTEMAAAVPLGMVRPLPKPTNMVAPNNDNTCTNPTINSASPMISPTQATILPEIIIVVN